MKLNWITKFTQFLTIPLIYNMNINYDAEMEVNFSQFSECPAPWISLSTGCYQFLEEKMTWNEANAACNNISGHLVDVETEEETPMICPSSSSSASSASSFSEVSGLLGRILLRRNGDRPSDPSLPCEERFT